ncbi:N-formylglutamate amidohydrolase [Sphingomonas sp.]|jgi:N-formylglutamate amidohydrolase|uniref:N-formylglutamate amidohydrolase n=1 Tax=Sphingomonas sp. TaxID=28214 RepID=UPI002E2EC615|nr:N-formylglutamate amidohydrolase [Sphingomonas sp.]HEX4694725.1 N-formylglutamate amidohydrolase [Sphingomonas sp.]
MAASFDRIGAVPPLSPVIVSVPHAGRDYPLPLRAAAAVPVASMLALEDRHADTLALAARGDETLFVQRLARAWIDLNRAEDERDPLIDDGARPIPAGAAAIKLRSGLGLVPRRAAPGVTLWRRRLGDDEVRARIAADHRPYHAALDEALAAARDRFGVALLIDLHSMPPLPGASSARIVIGDRFGHSAGGRLVYRLEAEVAAAGQRAALNAPYPGGHILMRHGRPERGVHAIQIEIDRRLYLDSSLNAPGKGLAATAKLLRRMIDAATEELLGASEALAAE